MAERRVEPVDVTPRPRTTGGVQSIERAFSLLEAVAASDRAMGLSQLAAACDLPLPTIHRLARTLVALGYLRQEPSRQYALGPRVLLLGESSSKMLNTIALPHLAGLVDELGETANLAMLDGDQVAYVAQVPGRHSMRMFTEVGRRVHPHCTAVGKSLLSVLPVDDVQALLARTGLPRHTPHTIVEIDALLEQVQRAAVDGYALDEGEQEVGVRCLAVPVPAPDVHLAVSISGPAPRMSEELLRRAVPLLRGTAGALARDLL